MSILEAIILGIVQGVTEFLPVSSSGHLKLMQLFLGIENLDQYIIFDLVCHLGTLCAIFLFFSSEIKSMLTTNRKLFFQIVLATLPLFPVVFFLKPIESFYQKPNLIGFFFLFTSFLLYLGVQYGKRPSAELSESKRLKTSFLIGCFQALAIFPGISRSGATISGARILGWNMQDALKFSFLLAIPAIIGAILVETAKISLTSATLPPIPLASYLYGLFTSLGVGYASLWIFQKILIQDRLIYFSIYCFTLGTLAIIYFNF